MICFPDEVHSSLLFHSSFCCQDLGIYSLGKNRLWHICGQVRSNRSVPNQGCRLPIAVGKANRLIATSLHTS